MCVGNFILDPGYDWISDSTSAEVAADKRGGVTAYAGVIAGLDPAIQCKIDLVPCCIGIGGNFILDSGSVIPDPDPGPE